MIKDVLIVGYGTVGHNLHKELKCKNVNFDIFDKFKVESNTKRNIMYDLAIICVDTPYVNEDNVCDISQVRNAISENDARIYMIKSTVLPGTTEALAKEFGKNIIFSPEYYGGTHFANNYIFDFTILGGSKEFTTEIAQMMQNVYDGRHRFYFTDSKTAELCKYMENSYLATKVSFCQQFFDIAKSIGVDYEELRELFVADPRIEPSHTFVFEDKPYWSSHCLNKDVPAIAKTYNANLLNSVISFNDSMREKYDA